MSAYTKPIFRILVFMLLAVLALGTAGGCSWMGRTAGKAQAKVERKVDAVEQGYHQGYSEEKGKSGSGPSSAPKDSSTSGGGPSDI